MLIFYFLLSTNICFSQENKLNKRISVDYYDLPLEQVLKDLSEKTGIPFSFSTDRINVQQKLNLKYQDASLKKILDEICKQANVQYKLVSGYIILNLSEAKISAVTEEKIQLITISGYITDVKTKEALIGATVYHAESGVGIMSNNYGFYSLTFPAGKYDLRASYVGYSPLKNTFNTNNNIVWNIELEPQISEVMEVVVSSIDKEQEVFKKLSGQTKINSNDVKLQAAALGETDVLKNLNNLPGISFHNDGSSYFYVRGGNRDQNLILIDEATIYNPSHLFGLFTPIIPEAVKKTDIYKADIPIQYGGRLSSVIDIRTNEGNKEKFAGSLSMGLITNRYNIEGPLFKKSSSYFLSYRRSHIGFIMRDLEPSIQDFYFNDFTSKFNFKLGKKDRLFITLYAGKDIFLNKEEETIAGLEWTNTSLTLRWNHIFGNRLFMNTTFYASEYDYFLHTVYENKTYWNSKISSSNIKSEFTFYLNPNNKSKFGINIGGYFFNPGNYNENNNLISNSVSVVNSGEFIIYYGNEHVLFKKLQLNYGFRYSNWSNYGEGFVVRYNENYEVERIDEYEKGKKYFNSDNWEPRISLSFKTGKFSSLKASYNRTIQHINLINNSIGPFNTLEVWLPSGPNIKPQKADLLNLSFIKAWPKPDFELNTDLFYKNMYNQVGYVDHAEMFINSELDAQIRQGDGYAYGFEILLRKTSGRLYGMIGYSYTRSKLLIFGLNQNNEFLSHQDKPIDFSLVIHYKIKPRILLNLNYIYTSGMRVTTPTGFYNYRGTEVPFYSEQSNQKLPDYKRLDIGSTFILSKPYKNFQHKLNVSVYNFFGYYNPAFIYFNKKKVNDKFLIPTDKENYDPLVISHRYLYLFVPSITYNLNF